MSKRICPNCLHEGRLDRGYCCPKGGRTIQYECGYCGYRWKRDKYE